MANKNDYSKKENSYSARTVEKGILQKANGLLRTMSNYDEHNFDPKKPHTSQEYNAQGISPFLNHTLTYLIGKTTVPVAKTTSKYGWDLTFTFGDKLLAQFVMKADELEKAYEVALKYGPGCNNKNFGIVGIGKDQKIIDRLVKEYGSEIMLDLGLQQTDLHNLNLAFINWHNPSGKHLVGLYNAQLCKKDTEAGLNNRRAIFLDSIIK